MPEQRWLCSFHHIAQILCYVHEELFAQTKNWIRENDVAWQFCMDPQFMVEKEFLQVTDEQIRNYIRHAEYL